MDYEKKDIEDFKDKFNKIKHEIGKAIIGQEDIVEQVLIAILCEGNVLLESVPGLGKTQMVKTIGRVLDLDFSRIQFTPDLMPADVVGTNIINHNESGKVELTFQKGPIFSNIVLADEINRATPKTQSAMLEAMQENTVTVGNHTYELAKPFFVIATQNPIEMEGTYPLPEAQMDRFLFKLNIGFPSLDELTKIVALTTGTDIDNLEKITNGKELMELSNIVKDVPVSEEVINYAMKLILSTHPESENALEITKKYVRYGSSPRGAQALIGGAKVKALIEGRFNVSYEDIKYISYPVLRHRVVLNFDAISDNITTDNYIRELIENIK